MSPPFVRGVSQIASTYGGTLVVPMPGHQIGDLAVLYAEMTNWVAAHDSSLPSLPPGYKILYSVGSTGGMKLVAYHKIGDKELDCSLAFGPGAAIGGPFQGNIEVYGNVDWRDPGWLEIPGTAGNYGTLTRADLGTVTVLHHVARVSFDALGVANWISGWANGDVGFGLNASNRPVMFLTSTVPSVIGNAAADADIPGLAAGQKVWLRGKVTAADAKCQYWYSFEDKENYDSIHWVSLGTIVTGTNAGTTVRVTNSDTVFLGAKDAATTPKKQNVYSFAEIGIATVLYKFNFSDPDPAGFAAVGTAIVRRPTIGSSSPIESHDFVGDFGANVIPHEAVYGADRLVTNVAFGGSFTKHTPNPITGPAGWDIYPDRQATFGSFYVKRIMRTLVSSVSTTDAHYDLVGYSVTNLTLVLRPLPPPVVLPTSPQPLRITLGCADSYSVWITDGSYENPIDQLRWSVIQWERGLDLISQASVTIPDRLGGVKCLAEAGGLEPWRYGVMIERNDQQVWRGPVLTVGRSGDAIVVSAGDVLARFQKRFLIRDAIVSYKNVDVATIFRDVVITHAASSLDQWSVPVPSTLCGVVLTRDLKPREFKYAWDLMSELLNSALDAFVMNGVLYVWEAGNGWQYQADIKRTLDGPYNSQADFVYGVFTEEAFQTRPNWTLDGMTQTNFVAVPSADTGEYGFRTYAVQEVEASQDVYGLLDYVDPDPIELPQDDEPNAIVTHRDPSVALQARANTVAALRSYPPLMIEGGVLSQAAPVNVDHLRPGSLWKIDIFDDGFGQLLTLCRLRRVSVTVRQTTAGVEEVVSPTLEPPGWQGGVAGV